MPSARVAPDGELSAGASFFRNTQHYNLGFQVLPWLEASFRYSGLQHFDSNYPVYYDRSFGLKARLWEESDLIPALALGLNDVVGTGIYGGEYLVASKRFGDFDTTLGIGWGRLGSASTISNPLAHVSSSFANRPDQFTQSQAGATQFSTLFHGNTAGIFGGVVWHTPLNGLALIAESSSDAYAFEALRGSFRPKSQINYGFSYQASEGITLAGSYLYGTSFGGSIAFELDPSHDSYPQRLGEQRPAVIVRTAEERNAATARLLGLRDPQLAVRNRIGRMRASERNRFVDAVLDSGNFADIRFVGQSMLLMTTSPSQAICRDAAAAAARAALEISSVIVSSGPSRSLRCDVPHAVQERTLFQPISDQEPILTASAIPALTIDASAVDNWTDDNTAIRKFRAASTKQSLNIQAIAFNESDAVVYYTNSHYFAETEAIERLTRLLMQYAPPRIERFRLIATAFGQPVQEFNILRGPVEQLKSQEGEDVTVLSSSAASIQRPGFNHPILDKSQKFPQFSWSAFPQFRQQLFDPNNPFGVQVVAAVAANIIVAPGLSLRGEAETSLFDTFNTSRVSDSVLPHVRTDFVNYFTRGKNGIDNLEASYNFRLRPDVFAVARIGYLESMFAGAGGEVLWRPEGARWALGVDAFEVYQRGFDRLLDLQKYHQFTGHISLYYASPWYDLNFQLRAGQYLAGDRGFTFQMTRRFSTGVEIGAFLTRTNVSAERFGEGSFDKGIFLRIPLSWIAPMETQNEIGMILRPVQRDGGQALAGDAILYEETRSTSEAEIRSTLDQ
jgi:exopolysaccharide biosynthesis protein YbjH